MFADVVEVGLCRQRPVVDSDDLEYFAGDEALEDRALLRRRGITPMIARRGIAHGSGLGKVHWVVERTFAWLHQFKRLRVAPRYEQTCTKGYSNSSAASSV